MDPITFDTLARAFATGGTRRRILAVLAALPLGGMLLPLGQDEAAAERPHERMRRRSKQRNRKQRNRKQRNNKKGGKGKGGKGGVGGPGPCTADGRACQQNDDCCGGNCFNQVCADTVNRCNGEDCPAGATGCCPSGCCASPANQCNGVGECCVPNCDGKRCGPDGCGNEGTCGKCGNDQTCNRDNGQCECTPQTCPNGCCDEDGACQPGNTQQVCGSHGEACYACGSNQFCSAQTGECRDNPPCSAETCPDGCCFEQNNGFHVCRTDLRGCAPGGACCSGCCDENDECQGGNDDGACGAGGSQCVACDPLDQCDQGRCQCDANNCPGCCDNGPGNPGFCEQGNTNDFCGFGGVLCVECPTGTTCNGQGQCRCLNTDAFCGAGDQCIACPDGYGCNAQGQCVCTAQSCPASSGRSCQDFGAGLQCLCDWELCHGCCVDGLCTGGGNTPQACRTDAGACTACPTGQNCVNGILGLMQCCPSGTSACDIGVCCTDGQNCCEGICCDNECCEEGTACCPDGVDCCNEQCCTGGTPQCCDVDGNGDLQCVFQC